jgi:hypothetical protein
VPQQQKRRKDGHGGRGSTFPTVRPQAWLSHWNWRIAGDS